MSAKELVKSFYDSDMASDNSVVSRFFHKDCEFHWNSSKGYSLLKYKDLEAFFDGIRASYKTMRFEHSHLLENNGKVVSRHTLYIKTIENPDDEMGLAHFVSIWEVKEGKLYKCHEISQLFDENTPT